MKLALFASTLLTFSPSVASSDEQQQRRILADTIHQYHKRGLQDEDVCSQNEGKLIALAPFFPSFDANAMSCECHHVKYEPTDTMQPGQNIVDFTNELIRGLYLQYNNTCEPNAEASACETCRGTACGVISASEGLTVQSVPDVNVTLADIFNAIPPTVTANATDEELEETGTVAALAVLISSNLYTRNQVQYCMDFSAESAYEGKACLEVDDSLNGEVLSIVSTEPQDCRLTYNSIACTGCQVVATPERGVCVTADCSAISNDSGELDTCADKGLVGPLQFLDGALASVRCNTAPDIQASSSQERTKDLNSLLRVLSVLTLTLQLIRWQ